MVKWNINNCKYLSIVFWNVQGIKSKVFNKLDDPIHVFINELQKHHIPVIGLQETHGNSKFNIDIEGFCTYQVNRPKSGNKCHGGIAILHAGITFYPDKCYAIVCECLKIRLLFHS